MNTKQLLTLDRIAEEFELIDSETTVFYNIETGEFDSLADYYNEDSDDSERFEEECWISAPSQLDIDEYSIMEEFADTVTDEHTQELLIVALNGKGAFRRFKDAVSRAGLREEWFSFRHAAFCEIAREWCEDNGIAYKGKVIL